MPARTLKPRRASLRAFQFRLLLANRASPKLNCNKMSTLDDQGSETETSPLLREAPQTKQKTPLPIMQISILMLVLLAEPIASMSIYPYINQV
jgi:hypothetical protein